MAQDEKRRQKNLMKKKVKDNERKRKLTHSIGYDSISGKKNLVKNAGNFPIYECIINENWQDSGMAEILLARKQSNSELVIGFFLVDLYCLGLKNTFYKANISTGDYQNMKMFLFQEYSPIACHPCLANRIIYGGIDYAEKIGFDPHKDFSLSQFILNERSDVDLSFDVEFGKDGKPLYVSGPRDNANYIIKKLKDKAGQGNFDYVMMH